MALRQAAATLIASQVLTLSMAIPASQGCTKRGSIVGVNKVNPGDPFDQTQFIESNQFDTEMRLTGIRTCYSAAD